jgi:flagellar protein FlgJ
MTEKERIRFLRDIKPHADSIERKFGIPAISIMAQAVLESGWGKKRIGNNIFGIKYAHSGKFIRVLTTEYSKDTHAFQEDYILNKEKLGDIYKFKVWQYFADYDSIEDAILSHSALLLTDRYKLALRWKHSPKRYLIAVWRSGYATDINYGYKILGGTYNGKKYYSFVDSITRRLSKL